jgi:hypothetical protein
MLLVNYKKVSGVRYPSRFVTPHDGTKIARFQVTELVANVTHPESTFV